MDSVRKFVLLVIVALLPAATISACIGSDTEPSPIPTATAAPTSTPTPSPTPSPTATSTPVPTSTPTPSPTPSPEPTATPTPTDRKSINIYTAAHRLMDRNEYADAQRRFSTAIEIEPEFARAWDGRGQARMFQGEFEEAMVDYDHAVSLRPNVGSIYGHRALARVGMGDNEGAKRDARRALELDDELVDAHLVLGRVFARENAIDSAVEHFDTAVALAPGDAGTYWWRGRFYRDTLRDGGAAFSDFNTAISLQPAQASFFLDRGILLYQSGMFAKEKTDMEEVISLSQDPKLPSVIEAAESWLEAIEEQAPGVEPEPPVPQQ